MKGHACGVRVDGPGGPKVLKVLKFDRPSGPEGCGIAIGHACGVRVLKIDGAFTPRVLKFDSGCAAEGYGSALSGTSINAAFGGI